MRRPDFSGAATLRARATITVFAIGIGLALGAAVVATTEPYRGASAEYPVRMNEDRAPQSDHAIESSDNPSAERVRKTSPSHAFNHRPIRAVKTITMRVTAYSPDEQSCGEWADGITASGFSVLTNAGNLVAADTSILPFGSLVSVPGYDGGRVVPVLDRGGAIKGHRLDVLFPTHEQAMEWGVRDLEVTIWEYDDGKANGFRQQHRRW